MKPGICFAQEMVDTSSLSIRSDRKEMPLEEVDVAADGRKRADGGEVAGVIGRAVDEYG